MNKTNLLLTFFIAVGIVAGAGFAIYKKNPNILDQSAHQEHSNTINFTAHKALYDIKIATARSGSQVINIAGQMFYEWQPTCDAWISNHRFNMLYEYADAPPLRITSDFSTFEAFSGQGLQFTSTRTSNGEVFEEIRGTVVKDADGMRAEYRLPEPLTHDLPDTTLFPIGHTIEVARRAANGEKIFNAVLFDGSDTEGPVEVNAFIGERADVRPSLLKRDSVDAELLKSPARNIRLAFFPIEEDQVASDYEMDLIFHDNGVISDMLVEYSDFSVTQELIALEKMPSLCEPDL